jgi:hypothetical protein
MISAPAASTTAVGVMWVNAAPTSTARASAAKDRGRKMAWKDATEWVVLRLDGCHAATAMSAMAVGHIVSRMPPAT